MSELIDIRDNRATIRWKLLTSASALALAAYVSSMSVAKAEDADRPLIWIELGGQMERVSGQGKPFAPAFLAENPDSSVLQSPTPLQAQKPPFSFGEDSKISFQPESSNWIFSAEVRYGQSSSGRHVDHQTNELHYKYHHASGNSTLWTFANFADTKVDSREHHAIIDFSAGKDVGLGMFGHAATTTLNFGIRFAQFASKASVDMRARPDLHFKYYHITPQYSLVFPSFHAYHAVGQASRSFRGMGPSLSWNGSVPFVGNRQDGELTIDWGANASILFGKQKAHVRHHETGYYRTVLGELSGHYPVTYQNPVRGHDATRSVTVPNVGGSVGLSWHVQDFKVSMGYRADVFFGAMDTGIDAVKKSNATFNGPYASISVGLGD